MRFGIIGAGVIGGRRAHALRALGHPITEVFDTHRERAESLAREYGAPVAISGESLVQSANVDAVIIATANGAITPYSVTALTQGKHVLIEKPGARFSSELEAQKKAALNHASHPTLAVGFNHRFHPGFLKLKTALKDPAVGSLMYIRARYGHGGRVGYDREWRADPALSGGGELLDQGVHLIDLCRWLSRDHSCDLSGNNSGELKLEWGTATTSFWDMPVDDNGFMLLTGPERTGQAPVKAFLHASCSEWKNLFDFEVFCRSAKLEVSGLGRSYGTEEFKRFQMKPEMGPPEVSVEAFTGDDLSWQMELAAFVEKAQGLKNDRTQMLGSIDDVIAAVRIVEEIYRQNGFPTKNSIQGNAQENSR